MIEYLFQQIQESISILAAGHWGFQTLIAIEGRGQTLHQPAFIDADQCSFEGF